MNQGRGRGKVIETGWKSAKLLAKPSRASSMVPGERDFSGSPVWSRHANLGMLRHELPHALTITIPICINIGMTSSRRRTTALQALASPVRQELMSHLGDGPATVTDAARHLGRSRQSLYYHVLALERAGLIRRAGTRGEGRNAERMYAVAADAATARARNLTTTQRGAAVRATAAMLRLTQREIVTAMHRAGAPADAGGMMMAIRGKARLDAPARERVRELIRDLIGVFRGAKGKFQEERPIALTIVLTPARESGTPASPKRRRH
jgi:DNA-binding transcriptional ArsR family regulator